MTSSIKFRCSCGKNLSAKLSLAGKRGKCPNCGQVFEIPLPELPPQDDDLGALDDPWPERSSTRPPAPGPTSPSRRADTVPAAKTTPVGGSLWDDLEYELKRPTQSACPQCAAAMPAQAVICVSCGYNVQTGQQLQGASTADMRNHHNRDSLAQRLLPKWLAKWHKSAGAILFLVILLFSFLLALVAPTAVMMISALLLAVGMLSLFLGFALYWPRLLFNDPARAFLLLTILAAPLFGYRLMAGDAFGGLPDPKYRIPRMLFKFGGISAAMALALMLVWFLATSLMQGDLPPGGRRRR